MVWQRCCTALEFRADLLLSHRLCLHAVLAGFCYLLHVALRLVVLMKAYMKFIFLCLCLEKRCAPLTMPVNGGFKCTDGAYFNSRCEYYCSPGYQLKGDRVVTCMDSKNWSGRAATCVGKLFKYYNFYNDK